MNAYKTTAKNSITCGFPGADLLSVLESCSEAPMCGVLRSPVKDIMAGMYVVRFQTKDAPNISFSLIFILYLYFSIFLHWCII